jgi:hypothetical protein
MTEDERIRAVQAILSDYLKDATPSHLRSPASLRTVARNILKCADGKKPTWRKWEGAREGLLESAVGCWIPVVDLRDYLNGMPGPPLTVTDVAQRLRTRGLLGFPKLSKSDSRLSFGGSHGCFGSADPSG